MTLNDFLDQYAIYNASIVDSFDNEWPLYKNGGGRTYTILFDGQEYKDAGVSLTFVDDRLVEGSVMFHDVEIIYVHQDWRHGYNEECKAHSVDIEGTANVWVFGDYIRNRYVAIQEFEEAVYAYAEHCVYQTGVPRYFVSTPQEGDQTIDWSTVEETPHTVQFMVLVEVDVSSKGLDEAAMLAMECIENDVRPLIEMIRDGDAVIRGKSVSNIIGD